MSDRQACGSAPAEELHELVVSRHIAAHPATVFHVYATRMTEWFAPRPWTTPVAEWDLRPGGRTRTVMRSPEGQDTPVMEGVVLEVVPDRRIVATDAFAHGWVPQGPFMVVVTTFEPEGEGTRYTARCRHWTAEARTQHEGMGFQAGWSQVADQLAALAEAADAA